LRRYPKREKQETYPPHHILANRSAQAGD